MENYYNALGISKSASDKEIRQAYRRLARKYHPDLNPGDNEAEDGFKRINEAYEVLSDPDSRKKYDRYGDNWKHADQIEAQHRGSHAWASGRTYRGGLEDLFESGPNEGFGDLFGRRASTETVARIEASVEVTLEESLSGAKRQVTITSGGKDRRIEVSIPPGVYTGSAVRISPGRGQELLFNIIVAPHKRFTRKGDDLITEVDVPLEDAILGGEVDVQTLSKKVRLKVPPESQNGQRIRLAGQGMPNLDSKGTRGDLYVVMRPIIPQSLTEEELDLVREFKALRSQKG